MPKNARFPAGDGNPRGNHPNISLKLTANAPENRVKPKRKPDLVSIAPTLFIENTNEMFYLKKDRRYQHPPRDDD